MPKRRGRGEGSIEKLPSGNYRAIIVLGKDPKTGRRVRLSSSHTNKSDALAWLRERQNEAASDTISVGGRIKLSEWFERWLGAKKTQVEAATHHWYKRQVDRHLNKRLGDIRLCDLNAECVQRLHSEMTADKISAGEQFKAATALRNAIAEAVKIGLISQNHATKVKRPKVRTKEVPAYAHADARRLIQTSSGWFGVFVRLGFDSGLRPQEMFALHWTEVDLENGTVRVKWALDPITKELKPPKTEKSRRTLPLGPPTITVLKELQSKAKHALVFPNARGGMLDISNLSYQRWKPLILKAGVPSYGLYSLRHTSATLLLAEGVNVKVVSERLGHESINITLKFYAHALPSMQSHAAAVAGRLFE